MMDQLSKPSIEVLNNDDDSDSVSPPSTENMLISTRSIPNIAVTNMIGDLSSPGSFFLFRNSPIFRIPRGLPNMVHRSVLPAAGANFENHVLSSYNEIDVMRQQNAESTMVMYRIADSLLERSMNWMILAAETGGNSRLISQQHAIQAIHQSRWFSITETLDHYRDMRLDVDNMSYEELLALEDHIGDVNTGLSEDAVSMSLKHTRFYLFSEEHAQKECCTICQEDYEENDELGTLICGHAFHTDCIKHWLRCKNLCPICKSTGLDATYTTFSQAQSQ